jgi:hypothetical protein
VTLAAVAVATLLPTAAHAEAQNIAPDFHRAYSQGTCSQADLLVTYVPHPGSCVAEASASVDGTATLNVRAATLLDGLAPGHKTAFGHSSFAVSHPLEGVTGSILRYRFLISIDEASVATSSMALSTRGFGYASLYASAAAFGATGQIRSAASRIYIVSSDSAIAPSTVSEKLVELTLDVQHPRDPIFADIDVAFSGYASAAHGQTSPAVPRGEASTYLDAQILGVSVSYL